MGNGAPPKLPDDIKIFREVFDASPIGIVVETLEGQPLFVNPSFCSLLGFSQEEVRSKHCVDFSPREDAEKDWHLFQQLKQGLIDHYQLDKRYFRRDGSLVWGRLSLSLLNSRPSPLVIAMVENITDRKNGEEALRESEERLRLAVQAGRMFAYSWDAASDLIERSGEAQEILGVENTKVCTSKSVSVMIHPDDRGKVEAAIAKLSIEKPSFQIHYRIIRPDGKLVWVERNSCAYFDSSGKLIRIVGMVADVSERKLAEQALATMNRRLIEAQEQERARIGRELHDDINQRLAILSIELEQLQENPSEIEERVKRLRNRTAEISKDVQSLSHELHPAKLQYLGVVAGMRSWCKEFSESQEIEINFEAEIVSAIPFEIGITLFRILQEALHNGVRHSGVKRLEVQVSEQSQEILLTIRDEGKGFDIKEARQGQGLGLASMEERAKLVNGTISIESKPMHGTRIRVHIPVASAPVVQRLAV